jgi:hypothetical protein
VNPDAILIDTSAWIVSFKKAGNPLLKEFIKQSILSGLAATSSVIILELVQGCQTSEERDTLKNTLESLDVLSMTAEAWERAYDLGFSLRRKGLTIPTVDLIIAAIAMDNKRILVHQDGHFEMIKKHYPHLRTKHFTPSENFLTG